MEIQKERNPRITEAIRWMKQEIKRLSAWQIECKKSRRLRDKELTPEIRNKFGIGPWEGGTHAVVLRNKGYITLLLNLYLAARGKEYRHGWDGLGWQREKEIHEKFPELKECGITARS